MFRSRLACQPVPTVGAATFYITALQGLRMPATQSSASLCNGLKPSSLNPAPTGGMPGGLTCRLPDRAQHRLAPGGSFLPVDVHVVLARLVSCTAPAHECLMSACRRAGRIDSRTSSQCQQDPSLATSAEQSIIWLLQLPSCWSPPQQLCCHSPAYTTAFAPNQNLPTILSMNASAWRLLAQARALPCAISKGGLQARMKRIWATLLELHSNRLDTMQWTHLPCSKYRPT